MNKFKSLFLLAAIAGLAGSCAGNLKEFSCLALGGENVPVGQYSSKILKYFELDEKALADAGLITYGQDVKAVTSQVKESLVSAGIIYQTDAYSAKLEIVDTATKEMCGQVIYPAAITKLTSNYDAAASFLSYLQTEASLSVFESVGFSRVGEAGSETAQVEGNVTLKIFAAASMTETLNQIKATYEAAHSNVNLVMNFGSSGALQTQIENGAAGDCDIFISAGQKQMNALDATKEGGKDLIYSESRFNILENKVALAVPDGNPVGITSFAVLKDKLVEALNKKSA